MTSIQAKVIGNIDGIRVKNKKTFIFGWACDQGVEKSIPIHLYLDERAGVGGKYLKNNIANYKSEKAVSNICKTKKTNHRFKVYLTNDEWKKAQDRLAFIHAISKNHPNLSIRNSGTYKFNPYPEELKEHSDGHLDYLKNVDNSIYLSGWGCKVGHDKPAEMELSFSNNSRTISFLADRSSEKAVANRCKTKGSRHRFKYKLPDHIWREVQGSKVTIKVKGLDAIKNSGQFIVPSYSDIRNISSLDISSEEELLIPEGMTFVIDKSFEVKHLIIEGHLTCSTSKTPFTITAKAISIMGELSCGSQSQPYKGELTLKLKEGFEASMHGHQHGQRAISVHDGGVLNLYGDSSNAGWLQINNNINKGDQSFTIDQAREWKVGDEIVISSTSFDMNEAERKIITEVSDSKTSFKVDSPFEFYHHGLIETFDSSRRSFQLNERAYVANLSRNIKITPTGGNFKESKIGAHLMGMRGSKMYVDSVEFIHMGQLGELARYPFHWHQAGNVNGQFIVNSSIHDSFQRCITVHGSNYALVKNNVCVDHIGHGFFLEDGNERKNIIEDNLGLLSRKPCHPKSTQVNTRQKITSYLNSDECRALLVSDFHGVSARFPGPSTYWISNPDNIVRGNIAAGSEGSGFWMAFEKTELCNSQMCSTPINTPTLDFSNNIAHSSRVGITWDGAPTNVKTNNPRHPNDRFIDSAHYSPKNTSGKRVRSHFPFLMAYKNTEAGLYFRGDTALFSKNIYADNRWSIFTAYSQHFVQSAIIGQSSNFTDKDKSTFAKISPNTGRGGVIVYDGPFILEDIDFFNFSDKEQFFQGREYTTFPIIRIGGANRYTNLTKGLEFYPEPIKRVHLKEKGNWADSKYAYSIRDTDGSLTGKPGSLIVQNDKFNDHHSCELQSEWNALICHYDPVLYFFRSTSYPANKTFFIVQRPDGIRTYESEDDMAQELLAESKREKFYNYIHHNKFQSIQNTQGVFKLFPGHNFKNEKRFYIRVQAENKNIFGNIVKINNKRNCSSPSAGIKKVNSLSSLASENSMSSYFSTNDELYIKLKTTAKTPIHETSSLTSPYQSEYEFRCK